MNNDKDNKNVYKTVGEMYKQSTALSKLAMNKNLSYDKAEEIHKKQNEVFKKLKFYKGFLNANKGNK